MDYIIMENRSFLHACIFNDISERDMDLLFLEEFLYSNEFLKLFTSKICLSNAIVQDVQISKMDLALGESDMTVILKSGSERIGLLIEDKIDALAMPEQAARYILRGERGIVDGDYQKFFVFIIAPRQYLSSNEEAHKYPNQVEYEEVLNYFQGLLRTNLNSGERARAEFKIQQIEHAIDKQKRGYQVEVDTVVTRSWQQYSDYQKRFYSDLYLSYHNEGKGTKAIWPCFRTHLDGGVIYHKTEVGFVDLTFDGCADRIMAIKSVLSSVMPDYVDHGFMVQQAGKSAVIRQVVPVLNFHEPLDEQQGALANSFVTIRSLSDLARKLSQVQGPEFILEKKKSTSTPDEKKT